LGKLHCLLVLFLFIGGCRVGGEFGLLGHFYLASGLNFHGSCQMSFNGGQILDSIHQRRQKKRTQQNERNQCFDHNCLLINTTNLLYY